MKVDLVPGTLIADRYRLERELGRGAFGVVMLATHERLGHRVAIKFLARALTSSSELVERFQREGQAAVSVAHPAVVEVLDLGTASDGTPYLVMEYLEGKTLREMMDEVGAVPASIASAVLSPLLEALAAAHAAGVVHRDLKPSNVMLATGPRHGVKLLDFGVARLVNAAGLTRQGVPLGTPNYMAPEQAHDARTATFASDLYSVGTMLFELLAGRLPFEAASATKMMSLVMTRPAPGLATVTSGVDARLVQLTDALLAKDPAARPATAAAVREVLLAAAPPDLEGLWTHVTAPEQAAVAPTHVRAPSVKPDQTAAPTDQVPPVAAPSPALAQPPPRVLQRLGIAGAVMVVAGVAWGVLARDEQHDRLVDEHLPLPVDPVPVARAAAEPARAVVAPPAAEVASARPPPDAGTVAEEQARNAATLKRAREVMLGGDLRGAWRELEACTVAARPCPEAAKLVAELEQESGYDSALERAEEALEANDRARTNALLASAAPTRAFKKRYEKLVRRVAAAGARSHDEDDNSTSELPTQASSFSAPYRDREARRKLEECIKRDRDNLDCHQTLFKICDAAKDLHCKRREILEVTRLSNRRH